MMLEWRVEPIHAAPPKFADAALAPRYSLAIFILNDAQVIRGFTFGINQNARQLANARTLFDAELTLSRCDDSLNDR